MKKHNWPILISTCLAFGGIGTVFIICTLIGFGLHSVVGKDALYVAFALQLLNLFVLSREDKKLSRGKKHYDSSKRMRRFSRFFLFVWSVGALLLTASLVLALCGVGLSNAWVRYPCAIGTVFSPIGWLGLLLAAHRHRQAVLCINAQV